MSNASRTIANNLFFASVEEHIASGRRVEMRLKGFSMRPFMRNERDVVVLAPLPEGGVRKGMVLLFRHKGRHILHRLVAIEGEVLTLEGDGNYRIREQCTMGDVVAYVSEVRIGGTKAVRYDTAAWRVRTLGSLRRKRLRTVAIDLKRKLLG